MENLIKHKWVAYGIDMSGIETVETEGVTIKDSHDKAVSYFNSLNIEWDVVESFDSFEKSKE